MLRQEQEFAAWGLSRLAIRNIILFFFAILLVIIAALCRVCVWLYHDKLEAERREAQGKDEAARMINTLRLEQIEMLKQAMSRQEKIEDGLEDAKEQLKRLVKR